VPAQLADIWQMTGGIMESRINWEKGGNTYSPMSNKTGLQRRF